VHYIYRYENPLESVSEEKVNYNPIKKTNSASKYWYVYVNMCICEYVCMYIYICLCTYIYMIVKEKKNPLKKTNSASK
jgi:hypothetical protein